MGLERRRLSVEERATVEQFAQQTIELYPHLSGGDQFLEASRACAAADVPYNWATLAACIIQHRQWGTADQVAMLERTLGL